MINNYLTTKVILVMMLVAGFCWEAVAQTYTVTGIPHQVYVASIPVEFTQDDQNSAVIPLPFNFTFFGNTYSQVVISTNGYIDFRTELAGQFSPWSFNTTIPNVNFPVKNSILGCFHDLKNSAGVGSLTYSVVGSAPYRKFVVVYNNQPQFQCIATAFSSFQMVLYETLNTIDVQIVEREVCASWNSGNAVIGLINATGTIAAVPPGRNTGNWTAVEEGWRFALPVSTNNYSYVKCDDDTDGVSSFNLQVVQNDLGNNNLIFYPTLNDAELGTNAFTNLSYTNVTPSQQSVFAVGGGSITEILLRVVNCANDYDLDSVATASEDLNSDTNLANDDTDADGIPDFVDNDDDGDMILTNFEYVFPNGRSTQQNPQDALDTDNDGISNYLDNDDDGDGVLTINEDYNGNNDPSDDDTNQNGTMDYLEFGVALGVADVKISQSVIVYPNPASDLLHITNQNGAVVSKITIYAITGSVVSEINNTASGIISIPVSGLQSGVYLVKVESEDKISNYKFVKK